jgi:hypothetical protein
MTEVRITEARECDIPSAVELMNTCFEAILRGFGIPVLGRREGDRCARRFHHPSGFALVALDDHDHVVAVTMMVSYGTRAVGGPLASRHPSAGASLMAEGQPRFPGLGVREVDLVTFPQSIGHYRLYQPLEGSMLTPLCPALALAKTLTPGSHVAAPETELQRLSQLAADERWRALESVAELTTTALRGFDPSAEIRHIEAQGIGDTLVWTRDGRVAGFACCHFGPGSEAFADDQLLIKLAFAGGPECERVFGDLVAGAEQLALAHQLRSVATMTPSWRRGPTVALRERGYEPRELHQYFHGLLRPGSLGFEARALADAYLLTELR